MFNFVLEKYLKSTKISLVSNYVGTLYLSGFLHFYVDLSFKLCLCQHNLLI